MSKKIENHCVNCDLPCLGNSCSYRNAEVLYCDICGDVEVAYRIENEDYCKECAEKYLSEVFNELSLEERAEVLGICIQDKENVYG